VIVGEARNFVGAHEWVADLGVEVIELDDPECIELLGAFIAEHPEVWHEDIGL
jgi:cytosine deaminase